MLFPDAAPTRFLELTNEEWALLVLSSIGVVAAVAALRGDMTLWPAPERSGLPAIAVGHLCMTRETIRRLSGPDCLGRVSAVDHPAPWAL